MIHSFGFRKRLALFGGAIALTIAGGAQATSFTSSTAFADNTTALTVENYGTATAGAVIASGGTLDGLTYSFSTASGRGGIITDDYNSFTANSLAAKQVAGALNSEDFFYSNESFTVTFSAPVTAVGIFANINLPDSAILTTSSGTAAATFTTYDTDTFGFLGFTSSTPFTSVTFESSDFNIAEIEYGTGVPEIPTWTMMLSGFGLMGFALRKRASRRVALGLR